MIEKILFGIGMLAVTLIIQFILYKRGKGVRFFTGTEMVFIMCILGLMDNDSGYLAGILGYVIGDMIGNYLGWHKTDSEKTA